MGSYCWIWNVAVPPGLTNSSAPEDEGEDWEPKTDAQFVAIVAVSAIVLTAAVVPCLIWSLLGVKGNFYI